jgi:predicted O-methyltransferase YrrM
MKFPTLLFMVDAHALAMINFLSDRLGLYSFRVRAASSVLSKKSRNCAKPTDYVNLSYDIFSHIPLRYIGWPIAPRQLRREIQTLLSVLSEKNIRVMLEIGTANGGTLYLFTRMINSNAKIISLDLPGGDFGSGYESFKIPFFTNFAQKNQQIFLVRADSHSPSSLSTVKSILKEQKLDFLFIDGDHTYEGVKMDFQMYSPLVRKGGLIAFHDICKHPPSMGCEVHKFWNEIKYACTHQEIISSQNQKWAGIGVLYT